jgi:hypothetical protein
MFGSADTDSIDSTLTETSATGAITYATTMTYFTEYYTMTHITESYPAAVSTYTNTYTWGTYSHAYTTNVDLSYVTYVHGNNTTVDFSSDFNSEGPICRWQDFGNGPFMWSGCKQFVLMIYNTPTKITGFSGYVETSGSPQYLGASGYIVVNRMGFFCTFPLEWNGTNIDWQFYFFYATYVGS